MCCGYVCPCSHRACRGHGGTEDREDKVDNQVYGGGIE
uniref:Uncharacterized protein n=1 Tax=Siphoviridae sp. ct8HH20 TaxID=2825359 RepID=A0A8S5Q697_9CAUD|nr:MAG TPA: hypothetical protein [Siphoviridae sp. ct8HH20]